MKNVLETENVYLALPSLQNTNFQFSSAMIVLKKQTHPEQSGWV